MFALLNFGMLQMPAGDGMPEHGQSLAFLVTLVIFGLVMALVLKRKITERFAILWMGIAFALMLASSFGYKYLFRIAHFFGIPYAPSALFLIAIFGLTLAGDSTFYLGVEIERTQPDSRAATRDSARRARPRDCEEQGA